MRSRESEAAASLDPSGELHIASTLHLFIYSMITWAVHFDHGTSSGPRRPLDLSLVFLILSFEKFHPCSNSGTQVQRTTFIICTCNNNSNNCIQGGNLGFFTISLLRRELSPTRTLKWLGCNRAQITCNTLSTYHVQHVVLFATRNERDSSAVKFDRVRMSFFFFFFLLNFVGWNH